MNRKQTILFFIIFFFMLAVMSIPLWLDSAIPILNSYTQAAIDTVDRLTALLKGIFGK